MKIEVIKTRKICIICVLLYLFTCTSVLASEKKDSTSSIDFDKAFNTEVGNTVLAKVGNDKITIREFLAGYEFGPAFVKREEDSKRKYLKYLIDEKLLALEGYKKGYADSARVKNLLEAIRGDLATTELFNSDIFDKIQISQSELNDAVREKQLTYQIKWIYAPRKDSLDIYLSLLKNNIPFDSLFNLQVKDSVYKDQRSMEIDKFKLSIRNPEMFNIVDTLKVGQISDPIKGPDGWYIVKLIDIWKNEIVTKSELDKEKSDASSALKLNKSDKISDDYVRKMMLDHNPVIQARAFDVLRSYMGKYVLKEEKFKSWKLNDRMQEELNHFDSLRINQLVDLKLVSLSDGQLSFGDFVNWYKLREGFLKFDDASFNAFSASLEQQIWQMVRDYLLVQRAYARGFQNMELVKQQTKWWEDKIIYAIVRDEMANSIGLNIEDPKSLNSKYDNKKQNLLEKTFRKLQQLRKEYKITINEQVLDELKVNDQDNTKTIDTYIIKKGGTFPHPAFPSIDYAWQGWE